MADVRARRCSVCGRQVIVNGGAVMHARSHDREALVGRFWAKVDRRGPDECWVWLAGDNGLGYGAFAVERKQRGAHRFAYELMVGPIPAGLVLDHLCRNTMCVNPAHLEPVTERTNILRGVGASARNAKKTHCPQGHELSGANLMARSGRKLGWRECRECHRVQDRERRRRQAAA